MIRLNISREQLENEEQLIQVVNKLLYIKVVSADGNAIHDKLCFDYYKGLEPVCSQKVKSDYKPRVINFAKPITDIATKVFIGDLPDITTIGKKAEKDKITAFQQKLYKREFGKHIYATSKNGSICGSGFLALYNEIGDTFPRFSELNPQFADVVYDCTLSAKPLLAFNIVENEEFNGSEVVSNYVVYVYTKDKISVFKSLNRNIPEPMKADAKKDFISPLSVFTINGKPTNTIKHGFKDIPIVEFTNNQEHTGDFECVIELIKSYNLLQNNRLQNVDDILQYVLMIKNARFGNEEETRQAVDMLEQSRILALEGDNVDAKFLSNPLNQSEMQTLANDIKQCIHYICRVPDLSSVDFSQNASDPIIKIKTKPLIDLCGEKELSFTGSYIKVLDMVLDYCMKNDRKEYDSYGFDLELCSLEYAHDLPSNDLDMATQIVNLNSAGILNPSIATQHISWIKNSNEYMKGAKKWREDIDKMKLENENKVKDDGGINEKNIERQNAKVVFPDQLDNPRNGAKGMEKRIVESDK